MKIRNAISGMVIAIALIVSQPASATTWNETGDAGEDLGTANVVMGGGILTTIDTIEGFLANLGTEGEPVDDIDMYKIKIVDPDAFSVAVSTALVPDVLGGNDTTLFLFDSLGAQVLTDNYSGSSGLLPAFLPGVLSSAGGGAGDYFLAISLAFTIPELVGSPAVTLSDWIRFPSPFQTGTYTLDLAGTNYVDAPTSPVPVPGALWLFGSGIIGLLTQARRRKQPA